MTDRWNSFCVVGLGGHARNKLIPALLANGQSLAGIVSSKHLSLSDAPGFASIDEALRHLDPAVAFIVASPPEAHFAQVWAILNAGRDVIVEKPAFVTAREAEQAAEAAERSGALLIEGFMNRYTDLHRRVLADFARERAAELEFVFTIPKAPEGTFRSEAAIGASNLYDMGCYLLAALLDMGLPIDQLNLVHVDEAGSPERERLHLSGVLEGVRVRALIGVDTLYANSLRLIHADGSAREYRPFVYGRPGERTVSSGTGEEHILEGDAFQAMFAIPSSKWRQDQADRLASMIEGTRQLERLGRALSAARQ